MLNKNMIITVLAFGLSGGTVAASGWEQAQAQQVSADQISSLSPASPTHLESDYMAAAPATDTIGGSLRLQGNAETIQLDVHHKTIGDVLSALGVQFNNRSSSALNEELNGRYAGSLEQILSRVLGGHDFAIKRENSKLSVIIFDRSGLAVVTPSPNPVSEHRALIRASQH